MERDFQRKREASKGSRDLLVTTAARIYSACRSTGQGISAKDAVQEARGIIEAASAAADGTK